MDLYGYAQDIVKWNWFKDGEVEVTPEMLENQGKLVEEEFNELLEAINAGPEAEQELIAEACDLFVVGSYYFYLKYGYTYRCLPVKMELKDIIEDLDIFISSKRYDEGIDLIWDLVYSLKDSHEIMEAKLKSNWSKLPKLSEFSYAIGYEDLAIEVKKECKRIEEVSKGRYTNVVGNVVVGQDARLVFRADNGKGKIVKPLTYQDWKEYI